MDWLIQILVERLLQSKPRISKKGTVLVATTGWKAHLLCVGFSGRKVTIDPVRRLVVIVKRVCWFVPITEVYAFDRILYILSGYRDWSFSNLAFWGAYRERDVFTVELRLTTGERIVLFRFYSEGDFVNDGYMPDFLYWDDYLDAALTKGNQGTEAEVFARLVAGLVGRPIHSD